MKHFGTRELTTGRLILRRFSLEDAEAMYRNWASDAKVTKFLKWRAHESIDVTKMVLTGWIASYEKETTYQWCIAEKEKNEPIGSISVVGSNPKTEAFEIGYCIGRKYWHQGITSEALKAVMQFLLEEVGAQRIEARHDPKNLHSGNVMKKCGMQYEGTQIRADWNNTGICDCALYGYVNGVTAPVSAEPYTVRTVQTTENETFDTGKHHITDEMLDYVGILAKLELSGEEKDRVKKDMSELLSYIDKLNELDTEDAEPMTHVFPINNVFREDAVTTADGREDTLKNAPAQREGGILVPETI